MRLNKKELDDFTQRYDFYKESEMNDSLCNLEQFLLVINSLRDVKNNSFLKAHKKANYQYNTIKDTLIKADDKMSKMFEIRLAINGTYDDIVDYSDLSEETKKCYHACVNYINEFC